MCFNMKKAISVRSISKRYRILSASSNPWKFQRYRNFTALDSVSFEIEPGELVGVIGKNGAGKSTLLKILTRITPPSSGEAELRGRVGSLLEVGTGFHPELTGRENIYLNGSILGMRRSEISSQFDAIVAFAGVERFLETPVKRYSSGMYVRLAFAVAAHLRSEILLVDEVLAVGDLEFQRHCLGKIREVANCGRTVLFVSHHLETISALCQRALVLEAGRLAYDGGVTGAIQAYMRSFNRKARALHAFEKRSGSGEVRVIDVSPMKDFYSPAEPKGFRILLRKILSISFPFYVSVHLVDESGATLIQCDSRLVGGWYSPESELELKLYLKTPWLKPGQYSLDVFICASGVLDRCEQACGFEIVPALPYPEVATPDAIANGCVFGDFAYEVAGDKRGSIRGALLAGGC